MQFGCYREVSQYSISYKEYTLLKRSFKSQKMLACPVDDGREERKSMV